MMAKGLRFLATGVLAGMLLFVFGATTSMAFVDRVQVTDKTIGADSTDTVWVYVENTVSIKGIAIPLIIREQTAGCFMSNLVMIDTVVSSRISTAMTEIGAFNKYAVDDGTCKNDSTGGFAFGSNTVDYTSPDAVLFAKTKLFSPSLAAGSDFPGTGTGIASFGLVLTAGSVCGTFEVDTTCTNPANHIRYVTDAGASILPEFTKGVVTVTGCSAVHEIGASTGVPEQYSLGQNRPNPFNASTVIEFTNRRDGHVRLDVFNILGQNVVTLLDEHMDLGTYAVDWDGRDRSGTDVASGMYFYRLQAGEFSDVKKMVLLK